MSGRPVTLLQAGFSYVEIMLAVILLTFGVLGASLALQQAHSVDAEEELVDHASWLVEDGLCAARSVPRRESVFGLESGETAGSYDDTDDLAGVVQSPPTTLTGETMPVGWQRTFTIDSVDPADPRTAVADGTSDVLRVRVAVSWNGRELASGQSFLVWR